MTLFNGKCKYCLFCIDKHTVKPNGASPAMCLAMSLMPEGGKLLYSSKICSLQHSQPFQVSIDFPFWQILIFEYKKLHSILRGPFGQFLPEEGAGEASPLFLVEKAGFN